MWLWFFRTRALSSSPNFLKLLSARLCSQAPLPCSIESELPFPKAAMELLYGAAVPSSRVSYRTRPQSVPESRKSYPPSPSRCSIGSRRLTPRHCFSEQIPKITSAKETGQNTDQGATIEASRSSYERALDYIQRFNQWREGKGTDKDRLELFREP